MSGELRELGDECVRSPFDIGENSLKRKKKNVLLIGSPLLLVVYVFVYFSS